MTKEQIKKEGLEHIKECPWFYPPATGAGFNPKCICHTQEKPIRICSLCKQKLPTEITANNITGESRLCQRCGQEVKEKPDEGWETTIREPSFHKPYTTDDRDFGTFNIPVLLEKICQLLKKVKKEERYEVLKEIEDKLPKEKIDFEIYNAYFREHRGSIEDNDLYFLVEGFKFFKDEVRQIIKSIK